MAEKLVKELHALVDEGACPSRGDIWPATEWPADEITRERRGWGWVRVSHARARRPLLRGRHFPCNALTVIHELVGGIFDATGFLVRVWTHERGVESPENPDGDMYLSAPPRFFVREVERRGGDERPYYWLKDYQRTAAERPTRVVQGPGDECRLIVARGPSEAEAVGRLVVEAATDYDASIVIAGADAYKVFSGSPMREFTKRVPLEAAPYPLERCRVKLFRSRADDVFESAGDRTEAQEVPALWMPAMEPVGDLNDEDVVGLLNYLEGFHGRGYAHFDIKPDNIMRYEGRAVLIDFDDAVVLDGHLEMRETFTPYYACFDPHLYGAVGLFELFLEPFQVADLIELAYAVGALRGEPNPLAPKCPRLQAWLDLACAEPLDRRVRPGVHAEIAKLFAGSAGALRGGRRAFLSPPLRCGCGCASAAPGALPQKAQPVSVFCPEP